MSLVLCGTFVSLMVWSHHRWFITTSWCLFFRPIAHTWIALVFYNHIIRLWNEPFIVVKYIVSSLFSGSISRMSFRRWFCMLRVSILQHFKEPFRVKVYHSLNFDLLPIRQMINFIKLLWSVSSISLELRVI